MAARKTPQRPVIHEHDLYPNLGRRPFSFADNAFGGDDLLEKGDRENAWWTMSVYFEAPEWFKTQYDAMQARANTMGTELANTREHIYGLADVAFMNRTNYRHTERRRYKENLSFPPRRNRAERCADRREVADRKFDFDEEDRRCTTDIETVLMPRVLHLQQEVKLIQTEMGDFLHTEEARTNAVDDLARLARERIHNDAWAQENQGFELLARVDLPQLPISVWAHGVGQFLQNDELLALAWTCKPLHKVLRVDPRWGIICRRDGDRTPFECIVFTLTKRCIQCLTNWGLNNAALCGRCTEWMNSDNAQKVYSLPDDALRSLPVAWTKYPVPGGRGSCTYRVPIKMAHELACIVYGKDPQRFMSRRAKWRRLCAWRFRGAPTVRCGWLAQLKR
ncbi:MAG: hypothetical protein JKY23_04260 [Nitrospinaceae bacterium]|nr:hypothetical protein [Nitrospinaceae bacterium]